MTSIAMEDVTLPDHEDRAHQGNSMASLPEDALVDYITDKPVRNTPKERVRQRIARALFHEYGIGIDDMQADFPVPVARRDGR